MADSWYYLKDDKQFGPVPRDKVVQLLGAGELSGEDLVWTDSMKDWAAAREVPGLVPAPKPASPLPAPLARPAPARAAAPAARAASPRDAAAPAATPAPPAKEEIKPPPEEEEVPSGWASLSTNTRIGILAGCGFALLLVVLILVLLAVKMGKGKSDVAEDSPKAGAKTGGSSVAERKPPPPPEPLAVISFDASTIKDAKEQEWYDTGKRKGLKDVDDYVAGFQNSRPSDDAIRKQVKQWLQERETAVHVACRRGERDRPALLAYGRRDGMKAGIEKHNLPKD
jgi:hypothetical protein